jgi:glycosyltransferase involved in cell wall biosynthesis
VYQGKDQKMTTLSVIIPAYNEEQGIRSIVGRVLGIRAALADQRVGLEVMVVDDGSRDSTATQTAEFGDVRLIRHGVNRGYGAAIKTGFRNATGEYLAFLDADGTYPPESLPELQRVAMEQEADMVVGSRMSGAKSDMPLTRRIGNLAYARLLSLIGNVSVRDTASGMRILRKEILPRLYPLSDGLDFTPAMSTRAIYENLKIVEVPIPYAERVGRSKLSVVRDGFRFTNAIVWTALAYNPVRILGLLSLALLGIASAIGVFIVALRMNGVTTLDRPLVFALFGAAVLTVMGVSLFALGA